MPKRPMYWLKLHTKGWLRGSIRFDLTPAERSVFLDLVALARESRNPPWVQANETTPYRHDWLASTLNIDLDLLESTLRKCKLPPDPRLMENSHGIFIINFERYQEREKPEATPAKKEGEGNIFTVYEQEIGALTPTISEELKDLEGRYPEADIIDAIKQAARANVRKLSYVKAVLAGWTREGKSTGGQKRPPKWMTEGLEDKDANT
jgi:DnaD/phage-associated family protein